MDCIWSAEELLVLKAPGCKVNFIWVGKLDFLNFRQIKRWRRLHLFAPNLTMNLTYLCYGKFEFNLAVILNNHKND